MQCKKICSNQISELFVACIDLFLLGLIHLMEVRKLIEKEKGEKLHVATQHDLYSFLQKNIPFIYYRLCMAINCRI